MNLFAKPLLVVKRVNGGNKSIPMTSWLVGEVENTGSCAISSAG